MNKIARLAYKKWVVGVLIIVAALVWIAVLTTSDNQLEVCFFDVGQGDAILIQKGRQQILIDGGPSPEAICLALGDKLPFWDRSIDLVVLTHPQDDHVTGLVEVLKRYEVKQVLEYDVEELEYEAEKALGLDLDYTTRAYEEWNKLIEEKGIKRTWACAGQQIELGDGIIIEVLHPQEEFMVDTDSNVNNNSVVLRLVCDEISFLLTGDIGEEAEREILHRGCQLGSTVLKVAHHGSSSSTCEQFLVVVEPQVAVISVGDNPFRHPNEETLARLNGVKVYRTDNQGTITFTTDGERLWVEVEK